MVSVVILDLKVKIVPKHDVYYFNWSLMPKLVGNDTSYAPLANLVQEISLFSGFQYGIGSYFEKWPVKILSQHFWEEHMGFVFFK